MLTRLSSRILRRAKPRFYSVQASFPGAPTSQYTETLKVERDWPVIPTYRVLDLEGNALSSPPPLDDSVLVNMYEKMLTLNTMDVIMYEAQRQGN